MRLPAALFLAAATLPAAAHATVHGNGEKTTVRRDLPAFTAIRLEGRLDADVKVGAPQAVAVTIDSNLQGHVRTRVERDTLVVETDELSYRGPGRVEVTVPSLWALHLEGSGDVSIAGGSGDLELRVDGSGDLRWKGGAGKLKVEIEGSSNVKLEGSADALALSIDGSGDVEAAGLTARNATVEVSGSGDADVTLGGGAFSGAVSGSGSIRWHGTAMATNTAVSGTGAIVHR
ncbi:head GIN domain-containing protein [Anaeromyxobacter oryzae]|uniref:DUF2807 domain-containing protein n=1 Tax=Anaeromyxobacter oryzae TaxID=2918170 RepID=A0ABM7WQ53_9BACT|nr:head GIN domain-containing protein [Anaeromyxobacter oryzae]BDG01597.1 DUF2807 domain-containing protein [Anaeromyxobacter oryzae]